MDVDTTSLFNNGHKIAISDEVKKYIYERKSDFRICTSCGGPVLLSTDVKPNKPTDLEIDIGDYTIYVSMYQASFLDEITMDMVPRFCY